MQAKEAKKVFNRIFGEVTILPSARRWLVPENEIGQEGKIIWYDETWVMVRTPHLDRIFTNESEKGFGWKMMWRDVR